MFLQCGKEMKIEQCDIRTIRLMIRQYNQGAESLHMFSHLCVVEYCHVEGMATPREEIL
jgi:hypothetical protein